jgi:hypothetical protein
VIDIKQILLLIVDFKLVFVHEIFIETAEFCVRKSRCGNLIFQNFSNIVKGALLLGSIPINLYGIEFNNSPIISMNHGLTTAFKYLASSNTKFLRISSDGRIGGSRIAQFKYDWSIS